MSVTGASDIHDGVHLRAPHVPPGARAVVTRQGGVEPQGRLHRAVASVGCRVLSPR
jgi:hypothetical protein